jgi:SAM-dependent methyltransferase
MIQLLLSRGAEKRLSNLSGNLSANAVQTNAYRGQVLELLESLLKPIGPFTRVLDFGSGDGWFAEMFRQEKIATEIIAVDVCRRRQSLSEPLLYDGKRLPFDDRSFELTYSIDVLHHCDNPRASLKDLLRCTDKYILLKDHIYQRFSGNIALRIMDELGNRRFGIASLYRYQYRWDWVPWIEEEGFVLQRLIHPAACHAGLLGWVTNSLQFVGLWKRKAL